MEINSIKKPLRKRLLKTYLIATFPIAILLILIVELFEIPFVKEKVQNELVQHTKIVAGIIHNTATVAIRNHLRAVTEKDKEFIQNFYELYKSGEISYKDFQNKINDLLLSQKIGITGYPYILNSKGEVILHPYKELVGKNVLEYDFIKKQVQAKEGFLEYEWQNPGEKYKRAKAAYTTYFEPLDWIISVSSYRDEFTHLLNLDELRDLVLSIKIIRNGYIYILDSSGKVLIHPHMPKGYDVLSDTDREKGFVYQMLNKKSGFVEYFWQNPTERKPYKKIAFFEHIPDFNWIIVATGYTHDIFSSVFIIRFSSYLLIALLILVGVLFAKYMSKKISQPIESAVEQIQNNIKSRKSNPIIVHTNDEIQFLVEKINDYIAKIEHQAQEIFNQKRKYLDLFETSPVGILFIEDYKIQDCNSAACELFAVEKQYLIDKDIIVLSDTKQIANLPPRELLEKYLSQCSDNEKSISFEWNFITLNREKITAHVQAKRFSIENPNQYVLFIIDITKEKEYQNQILELNESLEQKVIERTQELHATLKKLEDANIELKTLNDQIKDEARKLVELNEKLLQSESQLKSLNETKDKFISVLAHDLRGPIAGIRSALENLDFAMQKELNVSDTFVNLLSLSRIAVNNTFELLENLLLWAKLQRDGFQFYPENNSLKFYINNCINIVKPNADNKNIKIINYVPDDAYGYFDEFIFQTIMRNLLMNAIKYSYENGEVIISIDNYEENPNCWIISVRDFGTGMDEETKASLFQLDKVASKQGTKGEKGSGLGLILCKEYIEKTGGKFFIESEKGKGTTFSFTIPKNLQN